MMELTKNFSLDELTHSSTAIKEGISNDPPLEAICNLQNLCQEVLQPLRDHLGRPVNITSGYRSRWVNALVGGRPNSQHINGEAADLQVKHYERVELKKDTVLNVPGSLDEKAMRHAFRWIQDNCKFDQLIWERRGNTYWIHVSCRCRRGRNRGMVSGLVI